MTGWPVPPSPSAHVQAAVLRTAFPQYAVSVLRTAFPQYAVSVLARRGEKPRLGLVSRDGGNPYRLISDDAREI